MPHIKKSEKSFFWPKAKNEEFSIDGMNILEVSFYSIVDTIRKIPEFEIDRKEDTFFFDKFLVDVIILFSFLILLSFVFLFLPGSLVNEIDFNNKNFQVQIIFLLAFCSILWAGNVYITNEFRKLTREKIIPVFVDHNLTHIGLYKNLPQIFCGTYYEWNYGIGFRLFLRTFLAVFFICFIGVGLLGRSILELLLSFFMHHNVHALFVLYLLLVNFLLIAATLSIFLYTLFTVSGIFLYLLIFVRLFPLEINPLIDMGGTEKFGKIIINCLYLISLGIGLIPGLLLVSQFEKIKIPFAQESFSTLGNATESMKSTVIETVKDIPITNLSQNFSYFLLFFLFIGVAITIIISLHYRIKERKAIELVTLEKMIKKIDISVKEKNGKCDDDLYLLNIYEKVVNLYEWPIRRVFFVELIVSVVPLLVSLIIL